MAPVVLVASAGSRSFPPFLPLDVREIGVGDPRRIVRGSGLLAAIAPP